MSYNEFDNVVDFSKAKIEKQIAFYKMQNNEHIANQYINVLDKYVKGQVIVAWEKGEIRFVSVD